METAAIVLRRYAPQFGELRPRHGRKIVMLEMQAVVDRNRVHRSVIGGGFAITFEYEVLLQHMRAGWMRAERKVAGKSEIKQRPRSKGQYYCHGRSRDHGDVGRKPTVERDPAPDLQRMQDTVCKGLRQQPEELAKWAPPDKPHLPWHGYIGIEATSTQKSVMQEVVVPERDCAWRQCRQIGENRDRLVEGSTA